MAELSVDDWMQGAPFADEVQLGGLTWKVRTGAAGIEGDCGLVVVLSETSFVDVSSVNYADADQACDKAKEVAPIIASRLPGGESVGAAPPPEVDPLANADPCGLLTTERQFPDKPDDELSIVGRKWLVFDAPTGTLGSCYVSTNTSKRSHVRIFSSSRDHKKSCDAAEKLAPEVSKNLPESR